MSATKTLVNIKFGFLTAVKPTPDRKSGSVVWECNCTCGNVVKATASYLRAGRSISCGCHLKLGMHNYKEKFSINDIGCWIWSGRLGPSGYGRFMENGLQRSAHRDFYELLKGKIPKGMLVCHTCDVRNCVNPEHLFLGTAKDNIIDCVNKGRHVPPRGSSHHAAKLTDETAREIKIALKNGHSNELVALLASTYSISRSVIMTIHKGIAWKHVSVE